MKPRELLFVAHNMRQYAHAPYSGFRVGAAVLCDDGTIITGANVEAGCSATSVCAERVALAKVLIERRKPIALAVSSDATQDEASSPCGICRQFFLDFPTMKVYVGNDNGMIWVTSPNKLLPRGYRRNRNSE